MPDNDNPQPCPGHVVKCGSCKGSGRDHLAPLTQKCGVCKGVGSVLLK
jgi:DnaJ-class molecular chaperone